MLCDYLFDMACLCEYVFICLCILCFGIEHVLIWCLIEFRSFRLLIYKVLSPNDVATLLFVLIRWVDFIIVFQDDFSTIFQSCIVFVVDEGVMVRNPKIDSKSKFGCPRYGWRTWECAREVRVAKRPRVPRHEGGRGAHGQRPSLVPWGPHAPHGVGDVALSYWPWKLFSLLLLITSPSLQNTWRFLKNTWTFLQNFLQF